MHKIWMVVDPRRSLFLAMVGVVAVAGLIHIVVLSSPRYCDHVGWCATPATFVPGQPVAVVR
ncbi:light-harvesting antenna LH1, alpha subunit [Falsiroseomonas selenitidurans]|uniref:Light-harvesting protein n=1 Tax=Falsiroseomonas selenitidurans TaxID=2716335 RepID=A0ABX1EDY8_9PROT|nr:light-harvesting antenna LH1, alpha subunit [Falsiroseomonas selenitidurans]NKC33968.1 light-harvesting protein [Falsiroseomonas selenitidurans]